VVSNCFNRRLLSSWYGQGCCGHLFGPLCTQLGRLCLKASLTHPPSPPPPTHPPPYLWHPCYFRLCSKHLSKSASPSSSYVSWCNGSYFPTLFCCKSYVATIKHKEPNIFNISNVYFSKSSNVCTWLVFQNQVTYIKPCTSRYTLSRIQLDVIARYIVYHIHTY